MPYGDRYWWLKVLAAPLVAALTVAAPWWYAANIAPAEQGVGISASADFWFTIGLGVALALTALYLIISGLRGRKRVRRRRAAIAGDPEAVPRSSIEADPDDAPDAEHLPMELLWRARGFDRFFGGCFVSFVSVVGLLIGLVITARFIFDMLLGQVSHLINGATVPIGLLFCAGAAFALSGFAFARRALPALFGRRFGVVADQDGITVHPLWGRQRAMRWTDVRLFEISLPTWVLTQQQTSRYFTLYSQTKSLRWREDWRSISSSIEFYAPDGITGSEMVRREIHLMDLIAARTGLRPRTFSRQLGGGVTSPAGVQVQAIVSSLFGGCLFGGLAALVVLAPLTPIRWLDAVFAAPLVVLVLACLFQLARHVRTLALPITTDPTFAYAYRPPERTVRSGEDTEDIRWYVLTTERPLWRSLAFIAYGALLVLEIIPFLMLQFPGLFAWLQPRGVLVASGMPTALSVVLLLPGLCGIAFILVWPFIRRVTINADESSLDNMSNFFTPGIPWTQVTSIVVDLRHGQPKRYTVLGRSGSTPISWPASVTPPGAPEVADPEDDIQPITPAELADLVSRRAGVPISRREG